MFKVPGEPSFGLALKSFRPLSYSEQLQVWGLCGFPHIRCSLQALFSYLCHRFLSSYLFLSFRSLTDYCFISDNKPYLLRCSKKGQSHDTNATMFLDWDTFLIMWCIFFFLLHIYNPSHINENVYFNLIYPRNTVQTVFWLMHVQMGSALCREQCFLLAALPYTPLFFSILHMIDWNWNMSQTSAWELSNRSSSDIQQGLF